MAAYMGITLRYFCDRNPYISLNLPHEGDAAREELSSKYFMIYLADRLVFPEPQI